LRHRRVRINKVAHDELVLAALLRELVVDPLENHCTEKRVFVVRRNLPVLRHTSALIYFAIVAGADGAAPTDRGRRVPPAHLKWQTHLVDRGTTMDASRS